MTLGTGWQENWLIRTKLLLPASNTGWVDRSRLVEKLQEVPQKPLTLVSAPAGSGKTSLLGAWAEAQIRQNTPVAWVTLDGRDNHIPRFLLYIQHALHETGIHLAPIEAGKSLQILEYQLITWINQIIQFDREVFLVLDDYHSITNQKIHRGIMLLMEQMPPRMHLLLASRTEPPLPVATYRAKGQLLELGFKELNFSREEMLHFLEDRMGLALPEQSVLTLEQRTEGWIAGLQLAALALRSRPEAAESVSKFDGSHPYVVDFLVDQVWQSRTAAERSFLRQTAILERMNAELCSVMTGLSLNECQEMLETLESDNLFLIPLDDRRKWFRYHALFATFLQNQLNRHSGSAADELHRKATVWFEAGGYIAEAVDHALASGASDQAAGLIDRIAQDLWMSGDNDRLLRWLGALPEEVLQRRPRLCIYHAWALNISGDFQTRDKCLRQVEKHLEQFDQKSSAQQQSLRGMLYAMYGIIACMAKDSQSAIEWSKRAKECLQDDEAVWRSVVYRNMGMAFLLADQSTAAQQAFASSLDVSAQAGSIYMSLVVHYELAEQLIVQGELYKAEHLCRQGLRLAKDHHTLEMTIIGAIQIALGDVLREWGRLGEAQRLLEAGIEIGRKNRSIGAQVCGFARLAILAQARGDGELAAATRQRLLEIAPVFQRTSLIAHQDAQAALWGRIPGSATVLRWTKTFDLQPNGPIHVSNEAVYLAYARLLMSQRKHNVAGKLLERLNSSVSAGGRFGRLVEVLVLQALCAWEQADVQNASGFFLAAVELAEPEGYQRMFLDEAERIGPLLRQFPREHPCYGYVKRLLKGMDADVNIPPSASDARQQNAPDILLVEPLSNRELEVLQLIAQGLTNEKVANQLVVAVSTVQWHTKNIYAKLEVHSRMQAVQRARELGYFS